MATHGENKSSGISIVDSTITIDSINNLQEPASIELLNVIPKAHDLSNLCNGVDKEFPLKPPVRLGMESTFTVYLDGVRLHNSTENGGDDVYLFPDRVRFNLSTNSPPPPQGSSLIVIYSEASVA